MSLLKKVNYRKSKLLEKEGLKATGLSSF